jgi:phosphopantothenoylcysteine decarboxylase/phosphopantothenate--cysteine ligase
MPRLLLTAGPTREPIDAVRFIGNRSSGRMGLAIAAAADAAGWTVTLLLGPGPQAPSEPINALRFETTAELETLLHEHWPNHDVLIMAAAVADERPATTSQGDKMARGGDRTLDLEPTPDLLAGLTSMTRADQYRIGFALEPETNLLDRARTKLSKKGVDAIVANPLDTMDATTVDATLLLSNGDTLPAPGGIDKTAFATWLLEQITPHLPATS